MNCFTHSENAAVGICAACGKGVCADCATDMKRGLACKDQCEPEVRRLLDVRDFWFTEPHIEIDKLRMRNTRKTVAGSALSIVGLLFMILGYAKASGVIFYCGLGSIAFGGIIAFVLRSRRRTDQFRLCPGCGYNMTGNTTGKCPECGYFA